MTGRLLLAAALLVTGAPPLAAQAAPPAPAEVDSLARVRVTHTAFSPRQLVGPLLHADSAAVVVRHRGDPVGVPLSAVRRIEVSERRLYAGQRLRRGARRGFVVGAVISGALFVLAGAVDLTTECQDCMFPAVTVPIVATPAILLTTTGSGALLDYLSPGDVWRRVEPPVRVRGADPPKRGADW